MTRVLGVCFTHFRGLAQKTLPLIVLACCAVFLWPRLQALDISEVQQHWQAITAAQWLLAAVLSVVSFWAVSQYDVLAHRQLGTGLDPVLARRGGLTAIAVSQLTGFGLVVSTLVRWRMLSGFGPGVAAQITAFVSLMFLASLAGITALICLLFPVPSGFVLPSIAVLAALAVLAATAVFRPRIKWRGHRVDLPTLRAMFASAGWASLDVFTAAGAFYVLLPPAIAPDIVAFLPVFCLALAAGLFLGTPGGIGPFEMTLLTLTATGLPAQTSVSAIIVAVFGFRLVYFAMPAAMAIVVLLLPRKPHPLWQDPPAPNVGRARRAETAVIRQTGGFVERVGPAYCATWQTGQALVALFDPFEPVKGSGFFDRLKSHAAETNRLPCLYKCSARMAAAARAVGWSHLHVADDAILDLDDFTLDCPSRSGLRRKLRKSERAGVTVGRARVENHAVLAAIDDTWQRNHGAARGGTMGRFCPNYISSQAVFMAKHEDRVVAFASFHVIAGEWALDVMRHEQNLPDGTMHALVTAGIDAARRAGAQQLSLSAITACPDPTSAVWRWFAMTRVSLSGGMGLRQFKSAFAPRWQPLYAAAPNRVALAISLLDITREVMWPAALVQSVNIDGLSDMNLDHDNDEDYEVASSNAA
ncbi:MAG: phosphatidylglycerol lysyltransferase domain-containing protein [Aliishimia sp.]